MPCGQNHCGYRIGREVYWLINMIKENTAVVMLDEGNPDCTRNSAREKKLKPINASCTFHQFNIQSGVVKNRLRTQTNETSHQLVPPNLNSGRHDYVSDRAKTPHNTAVRIDGIY